MTRPSADSSMQSLAPGRWPHLSSPPWRACFSHPFQTLRLLPVQGWISPAQRLAGQVVSHLEQTLTNEKQDKQEPSEKYLANPLQTHTPMDCSRQGPPWESTPRYWHISFASGSVLQRTQAKTLSL